MAILKHKFQFRAPTAVMLANNAKDGLPEPIKREELEVEINFLSIEDVINLLNNGDDATKATLLGQANQLLIDEVRSQIDDQPNYQNIDVSKLDFSKVDFVTIANTPKSARAGSGISDEAWAAFGKDFVDTLVAATASTSSPRTPEMLATPVKLLTKSLKDVSKNEQTLVLLKQFLDAWYTRTSAESQNLFADQYERLTARIDGYILKVNDNPLEAITFE